MPRPLGSKNKPKIPLSEQPPPRKPGRPSRQDLIKREMEQLSERQKVKEIARFHETQSLLTDEVARARYRLTAREEVVENWVIDRALLADVIIEDVLTDIKRNTEEKMSPLGAVEVLQMDQAAKKANVERLNVAISLKNTALGVPSKLTSNFSHTTHSRVQVTETVVNIPRDAQGAEFEEFEIEPPLALPQGESVEGEVIEYSETEYGDVDDFEEVE